MTGITTEIIKPACGIIATIVSIIGFIPYLKDIFRRKTQPHSYTWLIWTILQVTGVVVMFNSGAGMGALPLAVGVGFCIYIFILSLKYGTKNITVFDTVCLAGALAAIVVYVFLHDAVLSVILVTIIDFVGFLPTLRKAYSEPYSETLSLFAIGIITGIFSIAAIPSYSIATTLYPAFIMFANVFCVSLLWIRRR